MNPYNEEVYDSSENEDKVFEHFVHESDDDDDDDDDN